MPLYPNLRTKEKAMLMSTTEGTVVRSARQARRWKVLLAGVLVAGALGGVALKVAWATPGKSITTTIISGPASMEPVQVVNESRDHGVKIKTRGMSDVYVVQNKILPGGHTGWHSHPGPSIVSVVSGEATEYRSNEAGSVVHAAGTAFVDEGGDHAHLLANEGTTDLVLVALQNLPEGAVRRIEEPAT
jgi:quercetin dioxygenase-like cupin family protein